MCVDHNDVPPERKSAKNETAEFPWHLGVYDAHCHPTDTMESINDIFTMKAKVLTVMATRAQDQELVHQVAERLEIVNVDDKHSVESLQHGKIIPSFGWHPWFSHQIFDDYEHEDLPAKLGSQAKIAHYQSVLRPKPEDEKFILALPDPRPLSVFIKETEDRLNSHEASLVGEVGLDRSFRIPEAWISDSHSQRDSSLTPGGREGRKLSPYRVAMEHQRKILLAQLRLAGKLNRPVSCHSVATHGVIFDTLRETWKNHEREVLSKRQRKRETRKLGTTESTQHAEIASVTEPKPYPPRVCLHSFSGPAEAVKQYLDPSIPCEFFFSFSTAINFSSESSDKVRATIKTIPEDKLLIESDLHIAGQRMDQHLEDIVRLICEIKDWTIEDGLAKLGRNWKRFVFGN